MSALTSAAERVRELDARIRIIVGLAGLMLVSLLLRSTALHARYWIDEGLSVGIASHPLDDIPGVLRQDGSPPLYYLLLGVWIRLVGDGEARTHALSLGIALLCIPVAFVLARRLFGERAGWFTAVIAALVPFLTFYAQETRMYTLAVLLSLVVAGTYALAYVEGRRRWLAGFVASGAALAYTHNWGLFMLAGLAVALMALLRARTATWRDALIGFGGIGVLYLPWVPTLLYQARHTGAPWALAPRLRDLPGELSGVLGGGGPAVALLLVGGSGLAAYLATRERPADRRRATAATTLAVALLVALLLAFGTSLITPAWSGRYFASFIGPLILLGGSVLSRAGTLGLATTAVLAGMWLQPPTERVNGKSNVHRVAVAAAGQLRPGDVVVSTHPEQVPVAAFYFPDFVRWADGRGWVADVRVMDWRGALRRYRRANPARVAERLIRAVPRGNRLVLMQPIIRSANWEAPWTRLVRRRAREWERLLDADPRLSGGWALPEVGELDPPNGVRLVVYKRLR